MPSIRTDSAQNNFISAYFSFVCLDRGRGKGGREEREKATQKSRTLDIFSHRHLNKNLALSQLLPKNNAILLRNSLALTRGTHAVQGNRTLSCQAVHARLSAVTWSRLFIACWVYYYEVVPINRQNCNPLPLLPLHHTTHLKKCGFESLERERKKLDTT